LLGNSEHGVIITLVAVFMLAVVGAMAALSIDVVTIYTARSEAQLAADAGALAGARVLANSGMTSAPTATVGSNAKPLAISVATQVAASNPVGGRNLNPGGICPGQEICVTINTAASHFEANPQVTVQVQRTDLPTFFARIWGRTTVTVRASATAEAYNPSKLQGTAAGPGLPVAPTCVKPWLLPNVSPNVGFPSPNIFDPATGAITDTSFLGWKPGPTEPSLSTVCVGPGLLAQCGGTPPPPPPGPTAWKYYPGDPADFPPPSASSVVGSGGFTNPNYQLSIAGCIQTPISCNSIVHVNVVNADPTRDAETAAAVDVLTHSAASGGDSVDGAAPSGGPFQFLAGDGNPVVLSGALGAGANIMVSDSLVTVPVIDTSSPNFGANYPNVQIIGFVQLFLNPTGANVPASNLIDAKVINLVGCGDGAGAVTGTAILGNGASPVAVRLISP
jgi:Flp pilus assembly protein TadG